MCTSGLQNGACNPEYYSKLKKKTEYCTKKHLLLRPMKPKCVGTAKQVIPGTSQISIN
jgi:hypothetical protein